MLECLYTVYREHNLLAENPEHMASKNHTLDLCQHGQRLSYVGHYTTAFYFLVLFIYISILFAYQVFETHKTMHSQKIAIKHFK